LGTIGPGLTRCILAPVTVVRIKEEELHLLDIASSPVKRTVAREFVGTSSLPDFDSPFPIPPDCTLHNPMRINWLRWTLGWTKVRHGKLYNSALTRVDLRYV